MTSAGRREVRAAQCCGGEYDWVGWKFEQINLVGWGMRIRVIGYLILAACSVLPQAGYAALDSAVAKGIATALGGKKVSEIINEARLSGVSLISQAENSANALISRAGNEATVLAGNMSFIFRDQLDESFDDLSEERKAILIEAEALRRDLASAKDVAYDFKDSTVLDLNALAEKIPFASDDFFIQSIRGLSYLPQAGDFRFKVAATTLGVQDGVYTTIKVLKGHGPASTEIEGVLVDQSRQRFNADISIPNSELASEFRTEDMAIVPLTLVFEATTETGWWVFADEETEVYEVPIYLNFFPHRAATVTVSAKVPVYEWVDIGKKTERYQTPNRHCDDDCRRQPTRGGNRISFSVPGGPPPYKEGYQRLSNPKQDCIGGRCGWSDSFNLRLVDNDTRLIFTWDTWSTSGTWEATADVSEYRRVDEDDAEPRTTDAFFGKLLEFVVSSDATLTRLEVETFTKQRYEVIVGAPDPTGLLAYQGEFDAGPGHSRIVYQVSSPDAVRADRY